MAKRISKKLLLGLGSTLAFGSIGIVAGFGLKSIIDANNQKALLNQINRLSEANFDTAQDYNKATSDMFINTTDLKSFHFGDVQKGQTITPYGWLGVFENANNVQRKIALTGWNGEILWVNDDYANQGTKTEFNVYDMKYDFNTDLIFVARTNSDNGLFATNGSAVTVIIDVLDAKTGIKKGQTEINQNNALSFLRGKYINPNDANHRARSKNLYSLDVISKPGTNDVVVSFTPNFLQLTLRQNSPQTQGQNAINRIIPFVDVVDGFYNLVTNFVFTKNGNDVQHSTRRFNIRKTNSFQSNPSQPGWYPEWDNGNINFNTEFLTEYFPIANPFITMKNNNFIVHFLVAKKNATKILHKIIEFNSGGGYAGNNGIDKSENVTSRLPIYGDGTWTDSKDWSNDFVNANLRINRNMFDTNSVVFAFPYAAGGSGLRLPIFNVAQLLINPSTGLIVNWNANNTKKSMVLPFGKEIVDYYVKNSPLYGTNNSSINKIYPFAQANQTNLNHNYHRLMTVSPFDNTVLFASKPNMVNDVFSQHNNNANKWANFWIGNFNRSTPYRPFMIYNDQSFGTNVDSTMTNINDLYTKGLTFDLRSLTGQSLNLYFNQTGSGKNDIYSGNGFRTSKIGLLTDLLVKDGSANIWYGNVTNPTNKNLDLMGTGIDSKSYSTLIYSRANLEKWYPRTWQNSELSGNLFSANAQINFNNPNEDSRAVARRFNSTLNEGSFFNTSRSVDLVSDWFDKDNKAPINYQRLLVKRPEIRVRNQSIPNKLPVETTYPLSKTDFLTQNIWIKSLNLNDQQKKRFNFSFQEDLTSASYQILSSWKDQIRMNGIGNSTTNLNPSEKHDIGLQPTWFDNHKSTTNNGNQFGKVNNDVPINGQHPLRVLLRIAKPTTGTLPAWFNSIVQNNSNLFDKYPMAKDAVNGETSFETILQKFIELKTKIIDVGQASDNAAVGLANLKIEAFVDLNPKVITHNDQTIYKKGNKRFIIQNSTGLRIIYEDKYNQPWREIYDQSSTLYDNFDAYGFGSTVRPNVQTSWTNNIPSATSKIMVESNAQLLQNNLVRKPSTEPNNEQIFSFEYALNDPNNIIINPKDPNWLKVRLFNFQRLINMRAVFEFQRENNVNSSNWEVLKTTSDTDMKKIWTSGNTFKLPSSGIKNIAKLRIRLIPNLENDADSFVKLNNYSNTDSKFISSAQESSVQRIDVDKNWFTQVTLSNSSSSLTQIELQDLIDFENKIFQKSTAITGKPSLRSKVKLMYKWNTEQESYNAADLVKLIKQRLNNFNSTDQGVFALWNGNNGIKIKAIFTTTDPTVEFITSGNNKPTINDLTGDVISNIKTEIDLSAYISQLQSAPIRARAGNVVGSFEGSSIEFPRKTGNPGESQFAGLEYTKIQEILKKVGITSQYKQYKNNAWNGWLNDVSAIDSYNPSSPQIQIGFRNAQNFNIKLVNGTTEINNNSVYTLDLLLPKLVKLPELNAMNKMINDFKALNVLSGDTKIITINNFAAGLKVILDALKQASGNAAGYAGLDSLVILKFKLGNSGWSEAEQLKSFLAQQTIDQTSNVLRMKIEIKDNDSFVFEEALKTKEFDLLTENNSTIKKYIHGQILEQKINQITASGNTDAIAYNYPKEIQDIINGVKQGLKLQYTYKADLPANANISSSDPNTSWADLNNNSLPTTGIPNNVKKIYVRLVVNDSNVYVYQPDLEGNKTKGMIDLANLRDQINVQSAWLNKNFPDNNLINFDQINIDKINEFETNVFNQISSLTNEQKAKLEIKYYFRGANNPVNKTELLNLLQSYKNNDTLDFLQLWNGSQGEKIEATFEKKEANGNYDLIWAANDSRKQLLSTERVINNIDLKPLVEWLEKTPINITKGDRPNTIASINFPNPISIPGTSFDQKSWASIEQGLKKLAIQPQYQAMANGVNTNQWFDNIQSVQSYDNRAQFKIRFKLLAGKGKNLIVKVKTNEELSGSTAADKYSSDIIINLAVPKVITVDPNIISAFRADHGFSGNTKYLQFNKTKIDNLLNNIKNSNLNSNLNGIQNAPLEVKFRFGSTGEFKEINEWKKYLELQPTDQITNDIVIKFSIPEAEANKWAVTPEGTYTIQPGTQVPIFVHDQGISEDIKLATSVEGDNTNLTIKFPDDRGFSVNPTNNTISGSKGNGLKLQFSLDQNLDVNSNTGWSDNRPTQVPTGTKKIFIRIVAADSNHVYEKQYLSQNVKIQIDFNIAQRLVVDKNWINQFKLGGPSIEIASLTVDKINEWINQIQNQVRLSNNNIDQAIAQKVSIKFTYKNQDNLDAKGLYDAIKVDRESFTDSNLGIVQLWNGTKGDKINAKFVTLDNTVIIQDANGSNTNLNADINLAHVFTQINLKEYVKVLETQFTTVVNGNQGQLDSFIPPQVSTTGAQFANKTFDEINLRLNQVGVTINFKQGNQWVPKENVNSYDVVTALLPLAFSNQNNNNIKLEIKDNWIIESNNNNQANPINLKLQVPKRFNINGSLVTEFRSSNPFGGNTRYLEVDQSKLDKLLRDLKTSAGAPQDVNLIASFRLNNEDSNTYRDINHFKTYLSGQTADKTSNGIVMKLDIAANDQDKWFIVEEQKQPYTVAPDGNTNIKFFINDLGIFDQLKTTRLDGDNTNLRAIWPQGFNVDPANGVLSITPTKGVGLRLEFTFDSNLNPIDGQIGTNPQNQWVRTIPTNFDINNNQNLYIRLQVTNDKYVYEKAPNKPTDKIALSLTDLFQKIQLDGTWLAKPFVNAVTNLENLTINHFVEYEKLVFNQMSSFNQTTKDKIKITYQFNGEQNLSKEQVLEKIQKYKENQSTINKDFGILKLWNNLDGQKITSTFAKKIENGNYEFSYVNPNITSHILDTSRVVTTINLKEVVNWLNQIKVAIQGNNQPNGIASLTFPQINVSNQSIFNGKEWIKTEEVLEGLGLAVEYQVINSAITNPQWNTDMSSITSYDARSQFKIHFVLKSNKASNVKVLINENSANDLVGSSSADKTSIDITVNLAVAKKITIDTAAVQKFQANHGFGGSTKNLTYEISKINQLITEIKAANSNNNIPGIQGAPLKVLFKLDNTDFMEIDQLKDNLAQNDQDKLTHEIKMKFIIDGNNDEWKIDPIGEYTINNNVKIFVHDAGIFNKLKTDIRIQGSNNQLVWTFPTDGGFTIQNDDTFANNSRNGKGLRLQFSAQENPDVNNDNQWVNQRITDVPLGTKNIFIRITTINDQYVYEKKINGPYERIQIDLSNIIEQINVKASWLNKSLNATDVSTIDITSIDNFETEVFQNSEINELVKNKLKIKYFFNNSNSALSKDELLAAIKNYKNPDTLDLLQLWNGYSGIKISATFDKKDSNGKYELIFDQGITTQDINTASIKTNIDLKSVVAWLKITRMPVNTNNGKISIEIPSLNLDQTTSIFHNQTWDKFKLVLSNLGIKIQYRELINENPNTTWTDNLNEIQKYDNRTKFAIRFLLEANNASNIKIILDNNTTIEGSNQSVNSEQIEVNLKIVKTIDLDANKNIIDAFINNKDSVSGNTRFLKINEQTEKEMISKILEANDNANPGALPPFRDAQLEVVYKIGQNPNSNDEWLTREQFIKKLESEPNNQASNQISFHFRVNNINNQDPDFQVDETKIYTLHTHEQPSVSTKIKYFILTEQWETKADAVRASGINTSLTWDFATAFGTGNFIEKDNKVFLKTTNSPDNGLLLHFTTKSNASYEDNNLSSQLADLNNKWVDIKPTSIPAGQTLKIRIVPNNGFVYEAATSPIKAKVHNVILNIQTQINVNKAWLNEFLISDQPLEINSLNDGLINQWITKIINKVATENNISNEIATKVGIKFTFNNKEYLDAQSLVNVIKEQLVNSSGIMQLWNGNQGQKIKAEFITKDTSIILNPNSSDQLSDDLSTKNIYTQIDLRSYVNILKSIKTTIDEKDPNKPNSIIKFTPPGMPAGNELLSGKSFDEISASLKSVGIKILFSKEKNPAGPWMEKSAVNEYNPALAKLFLAFENVADNNVKLLINDNDLIDANSDNKNNPIELQLNVPKQINIKDSDLINFDTTINFGGDTKRITFSETAVSDLITKILKRNGDEANNDETFKSAPLIIEFKIGDSEWTKSDQLKKHLTDLNTDLTSRTIKYRFKLENNSEWELTPGHDQERILKDENNSPLKIYVNDNGIFQDLGETKFSGTNEALAWNWKQGINVNSIDGELRKNINGKTSGVGLRVGYSFDQTKWTNQQPSSYNQDVDKVYLRIELEDANKYVYEKENNVIELKLNLPVNIRLQKQWLTQDLIKDLISMDDFLNQLEQTLTNYEQKVIDQARQNGILETVLNKFKIQYLFGDDNNLLDKNQLIAKIKKYSIANANNSSFGILQFWNQTSGVQIKAQFSDADLNDNFKIIVEPDANPVLLDTSKIQTTIDFSPVLNWLTALTMKVPIEEGNSPNSISKIKIPNTSGLTNSPFDNKEWSAIETALSNFGITIQYKADGNVTNASWGSLSSIKSYDPASGQIQFKFIFDKTKSKNIKLKLGNNNHDGSTTDESSVYKFKLNVKLNLIVDITKIDEFIQNANIKGNTKSIEFDQVAETSLISAIKTINSQNNPAFANVKLKVQYYLGSENDQNIQWRDWNDFSKNLASSNIDQRSNRVIFKLVIDPSQSEEFSVSDQIYILHDEQKLTPENWKVKYFINAANWEDNAGKISVKGTSSTVIWGYDIFGNSNIIKETNNKVFIKNAYGQKALQVYFSVKPNITYNEANSDNLNEINSKWVSIEPQQFLDDWNVSKLYVKLVPVTGYVYEPAESVNNNNPTARAHEISLRNIKLEIKVNPAVLETKLNLDASKKYVNDLTKNNIDQFVINALNTITNTNLREKVDVRFKFNSQASLDAQGLFNAIQTFLNKQNNQAKNILQLWNKNSGQKIEAQFVLKENAKDQYILIDSQNSQADANRLVTIDTSAIKTLINLETIVSDLAKLKINVSLPSQSLYDLSPLDRLDMPAIPNSDNSSELQGLTWEQFETKLLSFGVAIEARAKVKQGETPKSWTSIKSVKEYDDNILALELRFKINSPKGQNIVLSVKANEDLEPTTAEDKLPIFEMSLKAPAKVVVSENLINTFKTQDSFTGNTKNLDVNSEHEKKLIEAIISENIANNPNIFNELTGRLEVQYYLGKNDPNNNSSISWRSATELQTFLATQNRDQITNQIWFRLNIKNSTDPNEQIFQVDQKAQVLSLENISATAKIKIYINETGFTNQIDTLKAVGSTDSFTINGLTNWLTTIPAGLEVQYSNQINPNEADDSEWITTIPTTLNSDKKLWVRFKVKAGYEFESARKDKPEYSDKKSINTDGIKVIIKLQTEWLEKILINGNTKKATINEQNVLNEIVAAGVLPTDQPDLIQLEYNIKGSSEWFTKSAFESKLDQLNGAKDAKNFILKRDDLQVRFNIKKTNRNDNYGLNIDNENVSESNYSKFNRDIVAPGRNESFKGYINLDQLKDFIADNFKIIGSTSKPKLIINKRDNLNTSFMPYISDNLFDIQFSTIKKQDGSWDWTATNQSILSNGQLINDDGLISQGITIGAEKHFAIRFISKDSNYDVYKTDQIQSEGYLLDLTSNVIITVEITNPFTAANKALGIWTRDDNKKAKYNQGQGGFKIVAAQSDWTIDPNQIQSGQQFLTTSNLTQVEKDALEFVYHIFPNQPSSSDVDELKNKITNYQDSSWKIFNPETDDWSGSLGLKVGDYVSVALRVKESYTNKTDGAFILKDDDYAMLMPIINGKEPGRVAGYQIDVDAINIQESNVGLFNNEDSTLPPIDGYTSLAKISLDKDEQGQYLGVDLDLQVYSEFYLNKDDGILVAPVSKQRLIKRDEGPDITNKGNYKDANGQDLKDKNDKTIPILKDANNRLSKPTKGALRSQPLDNLGSGEFKLPPTLTPDQNEKLSFFRNQDIDVKLKGRIGQGTEELPDYYANKEKVIELKDLISSRIKFTVDNDKNVKYEWPQEEFNPDQIKYQNSDNTPGAAKDGKAEVATILKIKRWENNNESVITGTNIEDALKKINDMLNNDFGGQLRFETIYQQATGNTATFDNNNIYQLKNLKNRDRITVRIVATDDDLYYTGEPNPLVINVNGLVELAPKQEQLQYLRVEQSGRVDGEGSFRVLVTDPSIPGQTNDQVLSGWKFMLRVWSKNKEIKTEWTDDQTRINNLENGDKVEWKLVSADGNPVDKAYYNTVALNHEYDENNHVKYNFAKVNFPDGETSKQVVEANIGEYPTTNEYPENSGYVIAGLKPVAELFKISSGNLAKIFDILNPSYVGLNHQGAINFDNQYLNNNYYVNTEGEIYQKLPGENNFLADDSNNTNELFEISIEQLFENITFYNQDPVLNPYQNGFKFSSNAVNINNHLSNGDQIWAQFNIVKNESNGLSAAVTIKLNTVNGLKNTSDPMSPFWYVLMALGGIATLGLSGIIVFVLAKRKKLKGKN